MQHTLIRLRASAVVRARALLVTALVATLSTASVRAGVTPLSPFHFYQGHLKQDGEPVSGAADFVFTLWNGFGGGATQVGNSWFGTNVPVTDGLVTSTLYFGPSAFDGSERWLQIAVRFPHDPTNTQPFVTLSPRQPILAAPYALYAVDAGSVQISNFPDGGAWALSSGLNIDAGTLHIDPTNNYVGIGTSAPAHPLEATGAAVNYGGVIHGVQTGGDENGAGVVGVSQFPSGAGVLGIADVDESAGGAFPVALWGRTAAIDGHAVFGQAMHDTGVNVAVRGHTISPNGYVAYFTGAPGARSYFGTAVGIGTTSPANPLSVAGNADFTGNVGVGTAAPGARLHVSSGASGVGPIGSTSLALESTTNHYLGMLQPNANEAGLVFQKPALTVGGAIIFNTPAVADGLDFRAGGNVSRMVVNSAGNVGIGTNAPGARLDVRGGAPGFETTLQVLPGRNQAANMLGAVTLDCVGTAGPLVIWDNLEVFGSAAKPGGGSWSVLSDARLKQNVRALDGALDDLLGLRGVTFEYRDPAALGERAGQHTGMIAQEVAEVFPQWVSARADGCQFITFSGFEALTVEALRELRAEKDAEIAQLRQEKDAEIQARRAEIVGQQAALATLLRRVEVLERRASP